MVLKPTLLGVEAPKIATWCPCGGVHVKATLLWEVEDVPFTVEQAYLCVECGERQGSADE